MPARVFKALIVPRSTACACRAAPHGLGLANDAAARAAAVAAGLAFAARHRGATANTLAALRTYL